MRPVITALLFLNFFKLNRINLFFWMCSIFNLSPFLSDLLIFYLKLNENILDEVHKQV